MRKFINIIMLFIWFLILPGLSLANIQLIPIVNKRYQLAKQLVKDINLQYRVKNLMSATIADKMKKDKWFAKHNKQLRYLVNKYFSWNNIEPIYVRIYAKAFTVKEMQELIKFYQSPLGKTYSRKLAANVLIEESKATNRYLHKIAHGFYDDLIHIRVNDFIRKAKNGDVRAQCFLGEYYRDSKIHRDYTLSLKWLNQAANNHCVDAMNEIALAYSQGIGVKKNVIKAVQWYKKAAVAGDQMAMFNLGLHYFYGSGIDKNYRKAFYWFEKASFRDEPHAQFMLAKMYLTGQGIKKNDNIGQNWLTLVAYRYYNPHFVAEVTKRDQYISVFVNYQIAQFLSGKPNYEKGTTSKMIEMGKKLSKHMLKICSVDSYV